MFVGIYFPKGALRKAGFEARDELEDPLDERLEAAGLGSVTGGGMGHLGSNIDVEMSDSLSGSDCIQIIRKLLVELKAPPETTFTVEGEQGQFPLYEGR